MKNFVISNVKMFKPSGEVVTANIHVSGDKISKITQDFDCFATVTPNYRRAAIISVLNVARLLREIRHRFAQIFGNDFEC